MDHGLQRIHAKIDRAEDHLDVLERKFGAWIAVEKPYRVHAHRHPRQGVWVMDLVIDPPIPSWVSILAGETIYQLRSSLDHLVTRVIERNGGQATNTTAFPVERTKSSWERRVGRRRRFWLFGKKGGGLLKGINPNSYEWALIEREQPYKRGKRAEDHPFLLLHDLWNWDKHRDLNAVACSSDPAAVLQAFDWEPPIQPIEQRALFAEGRALKSGAPFARFRFPVDGPFPQMKMERPLPFDISLSYGQRQGRDGAEFVDLTEVSAYLRAFIKEFE